ncbi:EAL domain-containing protein [Caballeronia sp. SBC1]|uniref:bifunctional diguanylate cyclase/phosphodiesterase n=1 Tax=Caballeronia sp. SBC1 TaxID=2705548 RepID=UPI0014076578|nr:EAL domain-containing protein [Caballeronia sp. SBC1]
MSLLVGVAFYGIVRDRITTMEAARRGALDIADAIQVHISGELVQASYSIIGVRADLQGKPHASASVVRVSLLQAMRYDAVSAFIGVAHGGEILMADRAGFVVDRPALTGALCKALQRTALTDTVEALPLIHDDERGIWYLPMVLRIDKLGSDTDTSFALVPALQLVGAASSLQLLTEGRFGLFTGEGRRLFRYLSREHAFEIRPSPVSPNRLQTIAERETGTFEGESSVDHRYDIFGYSRSRSLPLLVVVGMPKNSLEMAWLQRSAVQFILLLGGCLASVVFALRLRKAVSDLAKSHGLYRQLFRSVDDGLIILDRDGVIQKYNPRASRLLCAESEQGLAGLNLFHLTATDRSADLVASRGLDRLRHLKAGETCTHDWKFRRIDVAGTIDVKLQLSAFPGEADTLVMALLRDVTTEREYLARQEFLANHDTLTGLLNRYAFLDHLGGRVNDNPDGSFIVALLDLNRFKEINDSLGHHAGDAVLEILGGRLGHLLERRSGCIARLGGDEIAVCADPTEWSGGVEEICRGLHAAIQKSFTLDDAHFEVTASVGVAVYPDDANMPEQLLRCADIAMYSAKRAMIPVRHYSPNLDCNTPQSLALKSDFARAIRDGDVFLAYQPKVRLCDGALVGFEALARWTHLSEGPILPSIFVPLAETTELIYPFTYRVLRTAIGQLKSWSLSGHHVSISVNVSANNLLHPDFVEQVNALLQEFEVSPAQLELEVTESALMRDPDTALKHLCQIRDMGVQLSIDDFGTGHSSLAYLKMLPVQILKIDQSFIASLMTDEADRRIVNSAIKLAHSFNMQVVAEGVETSDVADILLAMGCDIAQGYFYDRPAGADEIAGRWLLSGD